MLHMTQIYVDQQPAEEAVHELSIVEEKIIY
jgi:hypothetical protein